MKFFKNNYLILKEDNYKLKDVTITSGLLGKFFYL